MPTARVDQARLKIGIYVGEGASHSWTWFVDLLEKYSYTGLRFLQEHDFSVKASQQDVLLVSGGDTFAVARALRPSGALALQQFLDKGGLYIGSCAGAYLPLHSSKEPLCDFNFVKSRINNLTKDLPPVVHLPKKFSNPYGSCTFVYHPVREDVRVRMIDDFPIWGGQEIVVPLYGGPPLQDSEDIRPLAYYSGFTEKTLFLTDQEIARQVYLGKVAACEKRFGKGRMVLLGPHFEHPLFPEGNDAIHQWIQQHSFPDEKSGGVPDGQSEAEDGWAGLSRKGIHALKKEVSNMRIRAHAMARSSIHWQIGAKVYEPEKIVHFVETVWSRLRRMPSRTRAEAGSGPEEVLLERAVHSHEMVKSLAHAIKAQQDSQGLAVEMFASLKGFAVAFLDVYFREREGAKVD